ncbi:MAG: CHAD domain-containing protein [Anaerolineae bacterium]|nr:CHAD domain-containing protein [Anaerolineae bacterium]
MSYDLTAQERATLNNIQTHGEAPEIRRAQIILLSADGLRTVDIATTVTLSQSQVHYWRREWRKARMGIFPNSAADEVVDATEGVIDAALDTAVESEVDTAFDLDVEAEAAVEAEIDTDSAQNIPGVDEPRLALTLHATIGMEPDDPMAEAGRKTLLFHFERMLLNEPGSRIGEDIEAVHDMRVATRRMRSAFRQFDAYYKSGSIKPFVRDLRRVARALGVVRDLDVAIDKAQRFMIDHPADDLTPILSQWDKQRAIARHDLIKTLDSKRFGKFVDSFYAFLTTPGQGAKRRPISDSAVPYQVRHVAPRLIYELYEQLRAYEAVLCNGIDEEMINTLHALRIDFKRFRYALEFFADVLGPEARPVIEECKIMQDHLGDLNDTQVAGESLRAFVDQHNTHYSGVPIFMRPDVRGVIQYARAQDTEQQRLLDTFPAAWANFNRDKVRRDLALAVAAL